jgi:hypothetical protein
LRNSSSNTWPLVDTPKPYHRSNLFRNHFSTTLWTSFIDHWCLLWRTGLLLMMDTVTSYERKPRQGFHFLYSTTNPPRWMLANTVVLPGWFCVLGANPSWSQ